MRTRSSFVVRRSSCVQRVINHERACGATVLLVLGVLIVGAAQEPKTVWTGAFSSAQAARGETVYKQKCTVCHADNLRGNIDGGIPLTGPDFEMRWDGFTVAGMVALISELMPSDNPGSLKKQEYVDILAFLYRFNGATMGATDLLADDASLNAVVATKKPGK